MDFHEVCVMNCGVNPSIAKEIRHEHTDDKYLISSGICSGSSSLKDP